MGASPEGTAERESLLSPSNRPFGTDTHRDIYPALKRWAILILSLRDKCLPSTLADSSDPLTMPAPLLKAHQQLDRAVDRCYRPEPFPSDRHRVEYLFALYEKLTAPLVAAARPARKGRRVQTAP